MLEVLDTFHVYDADLLIPGGNRGQIPTRLDTHFGELGFDPVRVNTQYKLIGERKKSATHRSVGEKFLESTVSNRGFEVDNFKGRVALDVEWNAKDGNLDRDLSAYRALYDHGLIDVGVIITRVHDIRNLALDELNSADGYRRLSTSTTTNTEKLEQRMTRGDSGGCPVLAVGIGKEAWAGKDVPRPGEEHLSVTDLIEQYQARKSAKDRVPGSPIDLEELGDEA